MVALAKEKDFNCVITDDEHEYENLDDLVTHCGRRIRNLSLKFSKKTDPYNDVRVIVKSSKVVLTAGASDDHVALEQRLRTYLKKRVPWFGFLMNAWIWIPILGGMLGFINSGSGLSENPMIRIAQETTIFILLLLLLSSLLIPHFFGGVYLQKKDEVVGFFSKYEKWIIAVVGAMVGVGCKWLLDHGGMGLH